MLLFFKRILLFLMLPFSFAASAQTTLGTITTGSSGCTFTATVCAGDTVHFTPQSVSSYTNYHWYNSSVVPANEIKAGTASGFNVVATNFDTNFPTINIVSPGGTYILTAEYTTPTGCTAINDTLIINYNPLPTATPASATLCETTVGGGSAAFTLTSLDATVNGGASGVTVTYHSTLANAQSGTSALTSPYTSASATIYARVVNTATGCYNTTPITLTVNPAATANAGTAQAVCAGGTVTLAGSIGGSAISSTWSASSGTFSNASSLTSTYTPSITTGTVTLTLTTNVPNATCPAATSTVVITVNPLPTLTINSSICQQPLTNLKYDVSFTASSGTNITTTAGTVSGSSVVDVPAGTNITITATNTPTGCAVSQPVNAPNCACPTVNAPVSGGDNAICQGATIPALTATVNTGETVDWYSVASGGTAILSSSTTYTPTTGGTYYAEARNTTTNCVSSSRTAIQLTINPQPSLVITNPSAVCSPNPVDITAASVTTGSTLQSGTLSYFTDAAATIALTTPSAITTSGTYYIKVTTSAGCSDIKPVNVIVNPLPDFTLTKPATCPGNTESVVIGGLVNVTTSDLVSVDGGTYGAYPGGGTISGLSVGAHTIALKNSNGCITTKSVTINAVVPNTCIPVLITKN